MEDEYDLKLKNFFENFFYYKIFFIPQLYYFLVY